MATPKKCTKARLADAEGAQRGEGRFEEHRGKRGDLHHYQRACLHPLLTLFYQEFNGLIERMTAQETRRLYLYLFSVVGILA